MNIYEKIFQKKKQIIFFLIFKKCIQLPKGETKKHSHANLLPVGKKRAERLKSD